MPANTLPGYIMGHRFSDDAQYYNSTTKRFIDQAGYGTKADLRVTTGDPIFETVSGNRCVKLNNTWHGLMASPVPWQGSAVFVIKPNLNTGSTVNIYPLIFGDAVTVSSNAQLRVGHFSTARSINWQTASSQLLSALSRNDDNIVAVAFSISQETRKGYRTSDGVTVSEATATASTINGNAVAMSSAQYGARFGNINGTAGNTDEVTTLTCNMFEQHFFSENILVGSNLALTAAFLTELKTQYGAS